MEKLIFQYILLFFLTINLFEAFSQTPILKLDDSRNYELYFVDLEPDYHEQMMMIKEELDPEFFIHYPKSKIYLTNDTQSINSRIFFHSKKTGISFTLAKDFSFFIDDHTIIKEFKKDWVGNKRSQNIDCGCSPQYLLYIIESNKIINELRIRESHNDVFSSDGIICYSGKPLDSLDKSNKLISVNVQFTSLEQKRNFIKENKNISGLYGLENINVPNYSGSFRIVFKGRRTKSIEEKVKNEIIKAYPGENFDIEASRYWRTEGTEVKISCDKSLGNVFTLYEKDTEWWPYNIIPIKIFSKDKSQIDGLIEKYTKE